MNCFFCDWRSDFRVVALAMLCVASLTSVCVAEPVDELRVMSFNVRFADAGHHESKSENDWNDPKFPRRDRAIRVVTENSPDLLGVQEAREQQVQDFKKALPEYEFYGVGRDDGKTDGEFAGIFYRTDRFAKDDAGSFWLSMTPEKPGTSFYIAPTACARVASWVKLSDKHTGRKLVVLNMHWDHVSESARRKSAALVRRRLGTLASGLPTIVMGDFNSHEDSPAVKELIDAEATPRLADSFREVHPERSRQESSFADWTGRVEGSRIDFILHTSEFKPVQADIVRTSYDGRWPSDHYPVTATFHFEAKSK